MKNNLTPIYENEKLQNTNYTRIVGIDEVGRGCWAGPVTVGVYEFNEQSVFVDGVRDSKLLSEAKRTSTYANLKKQRYEVLYGSVEDISRDGIGNVLNQTILNIVNEFDDGKTLILLDGYFALKFSKNVLMLKKGDMNYYSIAAASILAKVERDRLMQDLAMEYPEYGFEKHKGYGTKQHREALVTHGICLLHRRSYKPIKAFL